MTGTLGTSIFTIVILILSVIMHEVSHGYAAYALGDPTAKRAGRLTLNPLAHIDLFGSIIIPAILVLTNAGVLFGWAKPVPYNPYNLRNQRWGEAIVGFAGVGTNLLLALIFAGISRVSVDAGYVLFASLAALVVLVNLSLGLFNLIPIPPLDGYTVLRGLLPPRFSLGFRDFENRLRSGGILMLLVVLLIFSYFLAGPFYAFVTWIFHLLVGGKVAALIFS
ncbi:MAG: site-2 protease family protein [Candidatus Pacebacteria bacterium]|nr:site-2 protease family protein [Candidatus Paceibacterota bacterium]